MHAATASSRAGVESLNAHPGTTHDTGKRAICGGISAGARWIAGEHWAPTTAGPRDRLGADQPGKHAMKPETIAKARTMLASVLLDGLSYREAGAPFGVGRSTVDA